MMKSQWLSTDTELLKLHVFYRESRDKVFSELIKSALDPMKLVKDDFAHGEFLGEAAAFCLKTLLYRWLSSTSNNTRYKAASELYKYQLLENKFFKVFN